MFQTIYDSPWVATFAVAVASLAALVAGLRRGPFVVAFFVLGTLEILADALRSGSWSPLHLVGSTWEGRIGIAFVLAGDLRFFLLVERFARRPSAGPTEPTSPSAWAGAVGWTLVVPVVAALANRAIGEGFRVLADPPAAGTLHLADVRWTYLVYEALFVALAVALRAFVLPRRLAGASPAVRRWLLDVGTFEIVQYALWALADVIILRGADVGFALRIVPNVMYYGAFLPFVFFRAPIEAEP
jgi:hypothetical protein